MKITINEERWCWIRERHIPIERYEEFERERESQLADSGWVLVPIGSTDCPFDGLPLVIYEERFPMTLWEKVRFVWFENLKGLWRKLCTR